MNLDFVIRNQLRSTDWVSDQRLDKRLDKTLDKWGAIKHLQVSRESNSLDNWRTDALQDIKTIGRNCGVPRYVRKRAAALFRTADDEGLPGGWMAFESVAVGTVVVGAREAGFTRSIDPTPVSRDAILYLPDNQ